LSSVKEGTVVAGRYRIEALLGAGGGGRVFRASQEPMGRPVALKLLRSDLEEAEQRTFEARFVREAALAGSLQHPNVVTIHDFGRTRDGSCYLVMELLEGLTLAQLLRAGALPARDAVRIFDQVAQGLRHAHSKGMVHRDIKPSNIFLVSGDEGEWHPKILDFGLVRALDGESAVTEVGSFLGTPHYMAPEQARGAQTDARSDVYATGVMFYRALCGTLPFKAENMAGVAYAHVHQPYPPMSERAPDHGIPARLEAVCRRAMDKDPERRQADGGAFLQDLREAVRFVFGPDVLPAPEELSLDIPVAQMSPPAAAGDATPAVSSPTLAPEPIESEPVDDAGSVSDEPLPPRRRRWLLMLPLALLGGVAMLAVLGVALLVGLGAAGRSWLGGEDPAAPSHAEQGAVAQAEPLAEPPETEVVAEPEPQLEQEAAVAAAPAVRERAAPAPEPSEKELGLVVEETSSFPAPT